MRLNRLVPWLLAVPVFATATCRGETGYEGWLRYPEIDNPADRRQYQSVPDTVVTLRDSAVLRSARDELERGVRGMFGRTLRMAVSMPEESAIVLGTVADIEAVDRDFKPQERLGDEGFLLSTVTRHGRSRLIVAARQDAGVLYGTFALLRRIALHQSVRKLNDVDAPYVPLRVINQWDNPDGSITRGYAGRSIFWEGGHVLGDLTRARDYARLLASVGINGCSINNVNADARVIAGERLAELARIAEAFRPWGVHLFICVNFSSPKRIGGLDTFDPLDPRVMEFWRGKVEEIYQLIPDLGGFVLKADSEGELGPSAYHRTHADAANVIARALKPHGGVLFYRGFVYDHHADWRDLKNDRARAAYDNFHPLDGKFEDNVLVQIKNGPIDFQVREPASPLFGGLEKTAMAMEVQITQEYLGQQRHLCCSVPLWKEVLDFDMCARGKGTPVKALVAGRVFGQRTGGFVGVANVGRDTNWLAHPLAMANLYGFGRLAWNPDLSARQVVEEWTRLTFGHEPRVVRTVADLQLHSRKVYEDYTGPLGAGGLTDIIEVHYGPGIESSERNGWGQWHRGDENGIGMDRTVATETGFTAQYSPPVAARFESLETCPDNLVLFFHHLPYSYVLHSGKTIAQHVYDAHYEGVEEARHQVDQWKSLRGLVDEQRFDDVLARLVYQSGHAVVWRDAVCQWFRSMSGTPDKAGRIGHYPGRTEAESMKLAGYEPFAVRPWETASGGRAVRCVASDGHASASFGYMGKPGRFDIAVQYFDQNNGASQFELFVANQRVDRWRADDQFPSDLPNGHTSTRRIVQGIALRPGDEIKIAAIADGGEKACLDYVEITPSPH